jgi:Flp pilus assembly protein TadD
MNKAETADTVADAAKLMGLAFVQIEEWHLARVALQRALTLEPSDGEAMAFLGHSEAQLGRPAFSHLARAVETRPDWPLGHYLLGLYYLQQEAYDFAVEEFQTTLRLDPGNAQAMVDLAGTYVGQGRYLEAEQALADAVGSAPEDLSFHKALVHLYADHAFRIPDRGLAAARAATDLAPEDPEVRDMLGWMYFLAGDPARARLHLESALRLDPESASVHYHLGVLRKALGEEEAARFAFLRAIDLDTDGFYRSQAQKALRETPQLGE